MDLNSLTDTCFAKVFFHSIGSLLTVLIVSFAVEKLSTLVQVLSLPVFVLSKKSLAKTISRNFFAVFSSSSFWLLNFLGLEKVFRRSLNYFELIFVYCVFQPSA